MSSGAEIQTHYKVENEAGVTPTTGVWQTLRTTGNELTPTINTTTSDEISNSRLSSGMISTSTDFGGNITGEFSARTFDDLLAAAFYSDWNADVLSVGSTRKTLSVQKGYNDIGVFTLFKGCHVGEFALEVPEDGKITSTFTMAGLDYQDQKTSFVTDPADATDTPVMGSGNSVGEILVNGQSLTGQACISAMTFNLNNNLQVQRCLGRLGPGAQIATEAGVTGTVTMAWSAAAFDFWKKTFTRETISLVLPLIDSLGNSYTLTIPAAEIDGDLPNGGKRDIVQVELTYTARTESPTITRELIEPAPAE